MVERRKGKDRRARPRVDISAVEHALDTIRFLRPEIVRYVDQHGAESAAHFEHVIAVWYRGTLEERVALARSCACDPALSAAWKIVHAAGTIAAPLIPYAVREYYSKRIDVRV